MRSKTLLGSGLSLLAAWAAAVSLVTPQAAVQPALGDRVIAWNNLGMHCMDDDFAVFALLPPFNTLHAQVLRNGKLVADPTGVTVTYRGVSDGFTTYLRTRFAAARYAGIEIELNNRIAGGTAGPAARRRIFRVIAGGLLAALGRADAAYRRFS